MVAAVLDLPTEVLEQIIDHVGKDSERYRLRLVCRAFWSIIEPSMGKFFKHFNYYTNRPIGARLSAAQNLITLLDRPELGLHVEDINFSETHILNRNCGFLPSDQEISLLSAVITNVQLHGYKTEWVRELAAGDEATLFKLLLILAPNLKRLRLKVSPSTSLRVLIEMATALDANGRAAYLSHLEWLFLDASGLGMPDIDLPRLLSLLRLPSLRTVEIWRLNAEAYEDNCSNNWPQLYENQHVKLESLVFEDSFIGPKYLTALLAISHRLRTFKYLQPYRYRWEKGNGPFEASELKYALKHHKRTLEALSIPNILNGKYSLYRSTDFTIGSLTNFSALKRLDIEQGILLGDPNAFCEKCLLESCETHAPYLRPYHSRQSKLYRLFKVLPPSIEELQIRECGDDIFGHLIELAEVRETAVPQLIKISIICRRNNYPKARKIIRSIGSAFGPAVSLEPRE